jgi:hypothetical protein
MFKIQNSKQNIRSSFHLDITQVRATFSSFDLPAMPFCYSGEKMTVPYFSNQYLPRAIDTAWQAGIGI